MSEVKVNKISPRTNCGTVTVGDSGDSVSVTAGVPVTVNGDLKSNALKAVDGGSIISQCGTNITLGASGDTINLAAGASQTGFGRTGTVDWQTSIKTSTITAVNGEGYFVDTTSGAITANLPAGSAGAIVAFKDYASTFDSNNLTISPNGSEKINNDTIDLIVSTKGESLTLVYADATKGWLVVNDGNSDAGAQASFITATGGTITTVCTNFKVHTFTGPGTFTVTCAGNAEGSNTVSYLVVAGGGGGATEFAGGGAGGFREGRTTTCSYTASPLNAPAGLPVSAQGYPITVGAGGAGTTGNGGNGANSIFSTITSTGGGGGGTPGGSGAGGAAEPAPANAGGAGNTPPVSPPQGQPGGAGANCGGNPRGGGGGGGATVAGSTGSPSNSGNGGAGATSCISGSPVARAGGGGGGGNAPSNNTRGTGGTGGGGGSPGGPLDGTANTGGGGAAFGRPSSTAGSGGSGIVIIRYKFQ